MSSRLLSRDEETRASTLIAQLHALRVREHKTPDQILEYVVRASFASIRECSTLNFWRGFAHGAFLMALFGLAVFYTCR